MDIGGVDTERMDLGQLRAFVEELGSVLTLAPRPGDGSPEISWGDLFFYYARDGVLPAGQPFATVVTKDYPDEPASGLDRDGAFRVNVAVGTAEFTRWVGRAPREPAGEDEPAAGSPDVVLAHPVYGALGWLAVVDPGPRTTDDLLGLLRTAHRLACERHGRRAGAGGP